MRTYKIVWILVWNNQELYTHVIVWHSRLQSYKDIFELSVFSWNCTN